MTDANGNPVITNLGVADENQEETALDDQSGQIFIKGEPFPCKVRVLSIDKESEQINNDTEETETIYVGRSLENPEFVPARFSPSGQKIDKVADQNESGHPSSGETEKDVSKIVRFGNRLPLSASLI